MALAETRQIARLELGCDEISFCHTGVYSCEEYPPRGEEYVFFQQSIPFVADTSGGPCTVTVEGQVDDYAVVAVDQAQFIDSEAQSGAAGGCRVPFRGTTEVRSSGEHHLNVIARDRGRIATYLSLTATLDCPPGIQPTWSPTVAPTVPPVTSPSPTVSTPAPVTPTATQAPNPSEPPPATATALPTATSSPGVSDATNDELRGDPVHQPQDPPQLPPGGWPPDRGNGGGVALYIPGPDGSAGRYEIAEVNGERLSWKVVPAFAGDRRGLQATSFLAGSNVIVQVTGPTDYNGKLLHLVSASVNGATEELAYPEPFLCSRSGEQYFCETRVTGWEESSGPLVAVTEAERTSRAAAYLYNGGAAFVVSGASGAAIDWQDPDRIVKNAGGSSCVTLGTGAEKVTADFLAGTSALAFEAEGRRYSFSVQDLLTLTYQHQQQGFRRLKPFSEYEVGVRFSLFQPDDSEWWVRQSGGPSYPADASAAAEANLCSQDGKAVFPTFYTPEPGFHGYAGLVFDNARTVYLIPPAKTEVAMHEYGHSLCQLVDEYLFGPLNHWSPNCARNEVAHLDFPQGLGGFGPPFYPGCSDMNHSRSSLTGMMRNPFELAEHNRLGTMLCQGILEYYGAEKRVAAASFPNA